MSKNLIENEDYQIVTPSENGLFTVATLNTNSESNSGLLEDFQNIDTIPIIPISTNSCFDLNNLPETETLNELLSKGNEPKPELLDEDGDLDILSDSDDDEDELFDF